MDRHLYSLFIIRIYYCRFIYNFLGKIQWTSTSLQKLKKKIRTFESQMFCNAQWVTSCILHKIGKKKLQHVVVLLFFFFYSLSFYCEVNIKKKNSDIWLLQISPLLYVRAVNRPGLFSKQLSWLVNSCDLPHYGDNACAAPVNMCLDPVSGVDICERSGAAPKTVTYMVAFWAVIAVAM